jgi:hypothetical protein
MLSPRRRTTSASKDTRMATKKNAPVATGRARIEGMSAADDLYDANVKVLAEYVEHHVKEEERELFPAVRKRRIDLATLGERIVARREELTARVAPGARKPKGQNGASLRT